MYLNLIQVAQSLGVSEKTVMDWVRHEGLPCVADRGRFLFDRSQVVTWASTRGLTTRAGFLSPGRPSFSGTLACAPMLRAGGIHRDVSAARVLEAIAEVLERRAGGGDATTALLTQRLRQAGGVSYAPVGAGYALPHFSARVALGRDQGLIAILFLREPLALEERLVDDVPIRCLLFFIAPSPRAHLDMLERLAKGLLGGPLRALLDRRAADDEILRALEDQDAAAGEPKETPGAGR